MPDVLRFLRTRSFAFALLLSLVLLVANIIVLPSFGSPNFDTNLMLFAPFALVAMAATPAILSGGGGIDMSVGLNAGLVSNVLILYLLPHGAWGDPWLAVPLVLALGTALGVANGLSVAVLRYQPVIATLCMLFVLQGINQKIAGAPTPAPPSWLADLAEGFRPDSRRRRPPGRSRGRLARAAAHALPPDPALRRRQRRDRVPSGVNVTRVRILAYALGGLFAAVAGIAIAALLQSSDGNAGLEYMLIALAAVALGGTPIGGGRGGLLGAVVGAAAIFLVENLLGALNVNAYWLQVAYGGMLIVGAVIGRS